MPEVWICLKKGIPFESWISSQGERNFMSGWLVYSNLVWTPIIQEEGERSMYVCMYVCKKGVRN